MTSCAFRHPITVHLRDLDALGHVNNAVYMTYLEMARNRWVFELTGKREVAQQFIAEEPPSRVNFRIGG